MSPEHRPEAAASLTGSASAAEIVQAFDVPQSPVSFVMRALILASISCCLLLPFGHFLGDKAYCCQGLFAGGSCPSEALLANSEANQRKALSSSHLHAARGPVDAACQN